MASKRESRVKAHKKSLSQPLEGDVGGLGDLEDGLVAGLFLPCGADGFYAGVVFGGGGVVDDEDLGADALGCGVGGLAAFGLPLAVDVDDAETGGEARGDLAVEEVAPLGFGDAFVWGVGGAEAKVEASVDPALGGGWVGGIALEGCCGLLGVGEAVRNECAGRKGEEPGKGEDIWMGWAGELHGMNSRR
jgi:hypothetical protein